MYVYDVNQDIVNLGERSIYLEEDFFEDTGYEYLIKCGTSILWQGTENECMEYRARLAEILDVQNVGYELTQTKKESKNEL